MIEYATNDHAVELALKAIPLKIPELFGDDSIRMYQYKSGSGSWEKRDDIS